jgi:8-oxo-dGTP pyrophosphatase MutT (NUDIX family)
LREKGTFVVTFHIESDLENPMNIKKVVSVFLRSNDDLYLLQLRDDIPLIDFPGNWGLFGGTIEPGESPREAAYRELKEEICYTPEEIHEVSQYVRGNYHINVCYAKVECPISALGLHEGSDLGMFSIEEILSDRLYSQKLKSYFPIAEPLLGFFQDYLHWAQASVIKNTFLIDGTK